MRLWICLDCPAADHNTQGEEDGGQKKRAQKHDGWATLIARQFFESRMWRLSLILNIVFVCIC